MTNEIIDLIIENVRNYARSINDKKFFYAVKLKVDKNKTFVLSMKLTTDSLVFYHFKKRVDDWKITKEVININGIEEFNYHKVLTLDNDFNIDKYCEDVSDYLIKKYNIDIDYDVINQTIEFEIERNKVL